MENKKNNKGFSLVELIVVVAIMAVLVAVLAPTLLRYVEKTRVQKDESAVSEVVEAAKIACAQESVATSITADGVTVSVSKGKIETTEASDAKNLENELKASVPEADIDFTSNAHKDTTYKFKVTYDAATQSIAVVTSGTGLGWPTGSSSK